MGRQRTRQTDAVFPDFLARTRGQPLNIRGVVVGLAAGLDRLPVAERAGAGVAQMMNDGCRRDGFSDAGTGSSYEETAEQRPASFNAAATVCTKRSRIVSERSAFSEMRSRAVPAGTLGGRMARTSKPSC